MNLDTSHQTEPKDDIGCCTVCSLPLFACLCGIVPEIKSNVDFWLITHDNEHDKPTNTGRLISASLPNTKIFNWSRVAPDQNLLGLLKDNTFNPFLVFPSIYAAAEQPQCDSLTVQDKQGRPVFVIIDATWQQARKIYRKSPYLHSLPLVSLSPAQPSIYTLRRNHHRQHLCTAEVAAAVLETRGELRQASVLKALLQVFCDRYQGAKLGQRPDNRFDARRLGSLCS